MRKIFTGKRVVLLISLMLIIGFGLSRSDSEKILGLLEESQPGLYQVLQVHDGDTIEVEMSSKPETIRMIGLDTPETHHPSKPVQCFGEAAGNHLEELIDDNKVRLEADSLSGNRDRYNRLLRYVYLPDGRLLNSQMIADGYGFAYLPFSFEKSDEFAEIGRQARATGLGLWSSCQVEDEGGKLETSPVS